MADSKHANDTNLDTFLEDIFAKHLNFSQSDLEVMVVQQLVHEMLNNILEEAYPSESGLTVREVIPVGSMAEGTRIIQPNEFDFMIVLNKFHADDVGQCMSGGEGIFLDLKTECGRHNCACALKESGPQFGACTTAKSSDCPCKFTMLDEELRKCGMLWEAMFKLAKDYRTWSVESFPGKLRLMDSDTFRPHGPATTFVLVWEKYCVEEELKSIVISVDLVLVIELEINAFFLDGLDVFHQHFYNKLKAIKKVHITYPDYCATGAFTASFALTEVRLLQDDSETHRKCYKLLKYIFRTNESSDYCVFTSFMLKNLVLQHAVCCEGGGLGWCLLKILCNLKDKLVDERLDMPFIPHIFCTKKNLVRTDESFVALRNYREECDHQDLRTYRYLCTYQELRAYLRKKLSEFIESLEKFRDGSPIPSSFQFRIPNHISYPTISRCSNRNIDTEIY